MISTAELTSIRAAVNRTLSATATLIRKTSVRDRSGGFIDSWVTVGTYDCSFGRHQSRPLERERDARIQAVSYWLFRFPAGTVIHNTDKIQVAARTFEVVDAGSPSLELSAQAVCQEIT